MVVLEAEAGKAQGCPGPASLDEEQRVMMKDAKILMVIAATALGTLAACGSGPDTGAGGATGTGGATTSSSTGSTTTSSSSSGAATCDDCVTPCFVALDAVCSLQSPGMRQSSSTEIDYCFDNGVKMTSTASGFTVYKPDGSTCYTIETVTVGPVVTILYKDANGTLLFTSTVDPANSAVMTTCDGKTIALNSNSAACGGGCGSIYTALTLPGFTSAPGTCSVP
jgi:hypothetical protein